MFGNYSFFIGERKNTMNEYVQQILDKLGTGFTVEIPVNARTLEPYLNWLAGERGEKAVKIISHLSKRDLQKAITALYRCESLDEFLNFPGNNKKNEDDKEDDIIISHDVMDTLERKTNIDVENYGTTDKGFSEIEK